MSITDKRPLKVFLCHAHTDRDTVRALYTRLTNDGVDAWLDKEKLVAGQDWEYEIRKAVRESDVVVVCHSKKFNQKGFRQKEVKIALEEADLLPKGEIFIIPARLEECDVLDELNRWHWVDLFEKDGHESLMRALRLRSESIGTTLQIKRSWLPKIASPHFAKKKTEKVKISKPVEQNSPDEREVFPEVELPPDDDKPPPPDKFPAGWDAEWQPSLKPDTQKATKVGLQANIVENPLESVKISSGLPVGLWLLIIFALIGVVIFVNYYLFNENPSSDLPTQLTTTTATRLPNEINPVITEPPLFVPTSTGYNTLYEWISIHPPQIKFYVIESINGIGAKEELLPVDDGFYIIQLDKDDLENGAELFGVSQTIQVEINIYPPDGKVQRNGCFVVNYGEEEDKICEIDLVNPVTFDIILPFATLDNGFSFCPDVGTNLSNLYYKDVMSYNIRLRWIDDSSIGEKELLNTEIVSNLIMPNETILIQDTYATSCEAILIISEPPLPSNNNSRLVVYSFRSKQEGEVQLDSLDFSPKYRQWLTGTP